MTGCCTEDENNSHISRSGDTKQTKLRTEKIDIYTNFVQTFADSFFFSFSSSDFYFSSSEAEEDGKLRKRRFFFSKKQTNFDAKRITHQEFIFGNIVQTYEGDSIFIYNYEQFQFSRILK